MAGRTTAPPALEVSDLRKSFGSLRAVDGVGFTVRPGETVALLGPNGSGKTTTLKCVAGLLRADSGTICIAGRELLTDLREARRQFVFLPQEPSFASTLTVREVVEFHARLRRLDSERVDAALSAAGLESPVSRRRVAELSGGMRHRLALAVAELPEVPVMLLDEPTANLDPAAALSFRELARSWQSAGRALLLSTHVLADVQELADRVVVLVDGRAVVEEPIAELRARLRRFSVLRVEVGVTDSRLVEAALAAGAESAKLNGRSILVRAREERRWEILERLRQLAPVGSFATEEPSLEQVYLDYVRSTG